MVSQVLPGVGIEQTVLTDCDKGCIRPIYVPKNADLQIGVENRDYHYLSQNATNPGIGGAKRTNADQLLGVNRGIKMRKTFEKVLRIYYSAPFWGIRMFGAIQANNIKSSGYKRGARSSAG
jgi:hypothetical protein